MLKRAHLTLLTALCAASLMAFPALNNNPANIQPNQWTSQIDAARTRAQQLNLPMLVICGDLKTCSYCDKWERQVIYAPEWGNFITQYPMILVMLDRSSLSSSDWASRTTPYRGAGGSLDFPMSAVHAPNGQKRDQFLARGALALPTIFRDRILTSTLQYYAQDPGTIGFSVAVQSVSEGVGNALVTVKRSDGKKGAQQFSYTTANGSAIAGTHYVATNGVLTWADGDSANKTFVVPLINDGRWTSPTQNVFSVSINKLSGDADIGLATQLITINEASPYAPGVLGFAAPLDEVWEGAAYTGRVTRVDGAVGDADVELSVSGGLVVTPTTLSWTDGDSADKEFVVTGIPITPEYDPTQFVVSLTLLLGDVTLGQDELNVIVHDQLVSQTLAQYLAGILDFDGMSQTGGLWFYNEDSNTLRTEPLTGGAEAILTWTATTAGIFAFESAVERNGISPLSLTPLDDADAALQIEVAGARHALNDVLTTYTVALSAGESVSWIATGDGDEIVAHLRVYPWGNQAPTLNSGFTPAADVKLQIDNIRNNHALVDLTWSNPSDNPVGCINVLYAGAAPDQLIETRRDVASGVNAVDDLGIVDLSDAQGWLYWRVDTELEGDFGKAVVHGPVWRFAVIDLPVFTDTTPPESASQSVFLKAGAAIVVAAESATPVTYSASGLPQGLTINPISGVISGLARKAGTHAITIKATNSEGSVERHLIIQVQPLPAYVAGAKMDGVVFQDALSGLEGVAVGAINLSASKSGKVTAKVDVDGVKTSLKGTWDAGTPAGIFTSRMIARTGQVLDVELAPDGTLNGSFNGKPLLARAVNKGLLPQFEGYYTTGFGADTISAGPLGNTPDGGSYLSIAISRTGKVKIAGVLADGTRVSSSTSPMIFLASELQAMGLIVNAGETYALTPINATLYGRRGGFKGIAWIAGGSSTSPVDNSVWLGNSLWTYPGKSAALTGDAFTAVPQSIITGDTLFFTSAIPVGSYFAKNQNLQVKFSGLMLTMYDFGVTLPTIATAKSIVVDKSNPFKATLKAAATTGIYSGKAQIVLPGDARPTKVAFKGLLVTVNGLSIGIGGSQVTDPTSGSYRLKRSHAVMLDYGPA